MLLQGFELFSQLFPTLTPYAGGQFRIPKSVDLIGSTIGSANASVQALIANQSETADPYWFPAQMDANNKAFPNWAALSGQQTQNGDRISNTFRQNFTQTNELAVSLGVKFPRAPQVFAAKDVLILTNVSSTSRHHGPYELFEQVFPRCVLTPDRDNAVRLVQSLPKKCTLKLVSRWSSLVAALN